MHVAKIITLLLALALLMIAGCDREVTETVIVSETSDCFTCHGDDGYISQAQGEWKNSIHASGMTVDYTNRSGCAECHTHQGFLEYQATGETSPPYDNASAIHCFTANDPPEPWNT